jgi:Mn-dependent DtxR family transcriptional regulator
MTQQGTSSTSLSCLISRIQVSDDEMEKLPEVLEREGTLHQEPGGQVRLTAYQRLLAEQIIKKYQILENFFYRDDKC